MKKQELKEPTLSTQDTFLRFFKTERKIESEESLKKQIGQIRKNIAIFLSLYPDIGLPTSQVEKITEIADYLALAESQEELEFYTDSLVSLLTIIHDFYSDFLNINSLNQVLLSQISEYEAELINYEELKNKFYSIQFSLNQTIVNFSYLSNDKFLNKFVKGKSLEFRDNLEEISKNFPQNEIKDPSKKTQFILKLKENCSNNIYLNNSSIEQTKLKKTRTTVFSKCKNSLNNLKDERLPKLNTIDNPGEFCTVAATTVVNALSAGSVGNFTNDVIINSADTAIDGVRLKSRNITRAVLFGLAVVGLASLFIPFPGSQILGILLLSKALSSEVVNLLKHTKKTYTNWQAEKRVQKVENTFEGIWRTVSKDRATKSKSLWNNNTFSSNSILNT